MSQPDLNRISHRGEGSTGWLHEFAMRTGRDFFSVDFAPEGYEKARRVCGSCAHRGLGEKLSKWSALRRKRLSFAFGAAHRCLCSGPLLTLSVLTAGEEFLSKHFHQVSRFGNISFAYLDNYDWIWAVRRDRERYKGEMFLDIRRTRGIAKTR